jgi:hypothetical protein
MSAPVTNQPVDVHALPAMLTALRLPSFLRHWQKLVERANTEGWPAARLLAALADIELVERDARRIQRHLKQSGLPGRQDPCHLRLQGPAQHAAGPDRGAGSRRLA